MTYLSKYTYTRTHTYSVLYTRHVDVVHTRTSPRTQVDHVSLRHTQTHAYTHTHPYIRVHTHAHTHAYTHRVR